MTKEYINGSFALNSRVFEDWDFHDILRWFCLDNKIIKKKYKKKGKQCIHGAVHILKKLSHIQRKFSWGLFGNSKLFDCTVTYWYTKFSEEKSSFLHISIFYRF